MSSISESYILFNIIFFVITEKPDIDVEELTISAWIKPLSETGERTIVGKSSAYILWIDNNPERELSNIDERFKEFIKSKLKLEDLLYEIENTFENYSFYIYDKGKHLNSFKELKKYLETQGKRAKKLFARTPLKKEYIQISLKDFDFILIDIFIGEKFDGIDLLKLFTIHFPEIPAFVLSVSDDYDTIASAIQEGADYYILKTQVLSIPYLYYQYLEKLGGIISLLEK